MSQPGFLPHAHPHLQRQRHRLRDRQAGARTGSRSRMGTQAGTEFQGTYLESRRDRTLCGRSRRLEVNPICGGTGRQTCQDREDVSGTYVPLRLSFHPGMEREERPDSNFWNRSGSGFLLRTGTSYLHIAFRWFSGHWRAGQWPNRLCTRDVARAMHAKVYGRRTMHAALCCRADASEASLRAGAHAIALAKREPTPDAVQRTRAWVKFKNFRMPHAWHVHQSYVSMLQAQKSMFFLYPCCLCNIS